MRQATAEHAGALSLVAVGAGLGPAGLAILTPTALGFLDPAIAVGLAALGVIAGLDLAAIRSSEARSAAAASIRSVVAGSIVAAGLLLLAPGLSVSSVPAAALALVAGVCAALSSSSPAAVPIVAGALALGWIREGWASGAWLTAHTAGMALAVALAGWLLLRRQIPDTDRRVFTVAMLLLIGGTADYLSMSALLGGLIAGVCGHRAGGALPDTLAHDLAARRHPLFAILLLVAGARTTLSPEVLALAIGYALLRGAGALAGRAVAPGPVYAPETRIPAALLAIAFALNALRAAGPDVAPALAVVVIGTLISRL
jgi:hypothetical protein